MKYLFILFTFMFLSCGESENVVLSKTEYQTITNQDKLKPVYLGVVPDFPVEKFFIVEIDSCEYIMFTSVNTRGYLTSGMHKGNCKFCSQRNVKQLSQNNN